MEIRCRRASSPSNSDLVTVAYYMYNHGSNVPPGFDYQNGVLGSRLFAVSEGDIVLWDANTLEELSRFDAPEPPDSNSGECFHPDPDGRCLWYFGQGGKVYRLDDRTGKFIEEVKLPFHVISLIREQ